MICDPSRDELRAMARLQHNTEFQAVLGLLRRTQLEALAPGMASATEVSHLRRMQGAWQIIGELAKLVSESEVRLAKLDKR